MVRRFFWAFTARLTRATVSYSSSRTGPGVGGPVYVFSSGVARLSGRASCGSACGRPCRPGRCRSSAGSRGRTCSPGGAAFRPARKRSCRYRSPAPACPCRCGSSSWASAVTLPLVGRCAAPHPLLVARTVRAGRGVHRLGRCRGGAVLTGRPPASGRLGLRRGGLGGPVRCDHHDHVAAVLLGGGLHESQLRDLLGEPTQDPEPEFRPALLPTAEHDRYLDLVTGLEEPHHVTLLGLVVVRVDLRPELHFLDDRLLLVASRFPRLECTLVLVLAEVHELAHGRARRRRNFDQVQVYIGGQLKGALQGDDAHLFALRADQPDLTCPDLFVDAWLDADVASSSVLLPGVGRPNAEGPGACRGPLDRSARRAPHCIRAFLPGRRTGPGYLWRLGWERVLRFGTPSVTVWSTEPS